MFITNVYDYLMYEAIVLPVMFCFMFYDYSSKRVMFITLIALTMPCTLGFMIPYIASAVDKMPFDETLPAEYLIIIVLMLVGIVLLLVISNVEGNFVFHVSDILKV